MAGNRGLRKKRDSLAKKVEDLENQLFAQKLLIDELESRLENFEKKWDAPFAPFWTNQPTYTPPPSLPTQQPMFPSQNIQFHICNFQPVDNLGSTACTVCGQPGITVQQVPVVTVSGNGVNLTPQQPGLTIKYGK